MTFKYLLLIGSFIISSITFSSYGQDKARIKEYSKEYITYPFTDANPIPVFGKTYPYYRFDGFTSDSEKRSWKIVELENEYLKIQIFPEIGGKIWSVIDKISGKEMFYGNEVVKFRDISLRGPWTSGGIEFNYGVVGHSPSTSFPVDYLLKNKEDGSVSCLISTLDLLTRTYWTVEINLPADKGWFTTRSFWHNKTGLSQPYYNWVNTGVKAKQDLMFIYPGTDVIQHDGKSFKWPLDSVRQKNRSFWRENDYGGSKSFHITGEHAPYFGVYWKKEDWGIMQYAERNDKPGRKIFSWALSDQGKIWEELLTDINGQYVELQSGRLYNQNMVTSSLTPFKQTNFIPYGTDVWTEFWFPYRDIGEVSNVTLKGIIGVNKKNQSTSIKISPLQNLTDSLSVYNHAGTKIYSEKHSFRIGHSVVVNIPTETDEKISKIDLGDTQLWSNRERTLSRPVTTVNDFDWNTAYGNYLRGRDLNGLRQYEMAEEFIRRSLDMNHNYIPALVEMSKLHYYHMNYDSAFVTAQKALSIDTYDADANYMYGMSSIMLQKYYDALDGFEIAALTSEFRSACYTELSKIHFKEKNYEMAFRYAEKSMINNQYNIEGLQLSYLAATFLKKNTEPLQILDRIATIDPLNHFVRFEKYIENLDSKYRQQFTKYIQDEMPEQIYLELALWYYSLNLKDRCRELLNISPENPELAYWKAYLQYQSNQGSNEYQGTLRQAHSLDPSFVFPFREESREMLEWVIKTDPSWKAKYYLALLHRSRHNYSQVTTLMSSVKENVPFAPFYIFLSQLIDDKIEREKALIQATEVAPGQWRYVHELTRFYLQTKENKKALELIAPFYRENKDHFPTGLLYARVLLANKDYKMTETVLASTYILPFEGARDGQLLYRQTKLLLAVDALTRHDLKNAQRKIDEAKEWPRNLGVGKPYEEYIDHRIENWLEAMIAHKGKNRKKKEEYLKKTVEGNKETTSLNALLGMIALYQLGEKQQADLLFNGWIVTQTSDNIKTWGRNFYHNSKVLDYPLDPVTLKQMIGLIAGVEDARLF